MAFGIKAGSFAAPLALVFHRCVLVDEVDERLHEIMKAQERILAPEKGLAA